MRHWGMVVRKGRFCTVLVLCLCGCAARDVTPVRISQPGDDLLSCTDLQQQLATNRSAAETFLRDDKKVEAANTMKAIGGALPWVGIFISASEDLSNEEQIKGRALVDRDERLRFLVERKHCSP